MSNSDDYLTAFTSADYALDNAARKFAEAEIEEVREGFRQYASEEWAEDEDLMDLAHDYVDGLATVIYTHRARALVIGCGEDLAREDYRSTFGEDAEGFEPLAYGILFRECSDVATEIEDERG